MPSVTVKRIMAAPRKEVWAALADIENAKRWNTSWSRIELTSTQRHGLGTTFRAFVDDGRSFDFEITEWSNLERITFTPVREEAERWALMLERHEFTLREASEEETLVELKAVASAHGLRGRLYGMFFWSGHQEYGLNEALNALQVLVEPPLDEEEPAEEAEPAAE